MSLAMQIVFDPPCNLSLQSISFQFVYSGTVETVPRTMFYVEIDDIHFFPLIYQASHLNVKDNPVVQLQFAFGKY